MKVGIPSALTARVFNHVSNTGLHSSEVPSNSEYFHLISNILVLKMKVWSLGKTEQKLLPSPQTTTKTILVTSSSPHKNREVIEAEVFISGISAPKTSLLFAQSCRSTYFLLQYFSHL